MSVPFHTQLQPFEENQSPSPTHELENPYELSLHRSRSPPKKSGPPSPVNTVNSLQRQLSGDPENPPPAWQRRPSVSTQRSGKSSIRSTSRGQRSPSDASYIPSVPNAGPPSSRRHPNLTMTATRQAAQVAGLPNQYFLHESPSGSSTSLDDPTLTLPRPAFGRRGGGSNRSSIVSSADLSSLTSEELWAMDQESMADMSNPLTRAAERPLDTVRRMSSRIEHSPYRNGLPQDLIWPSAPPPEEAYSPPIKSRSVTSMASLRGVKQRPSKRQSRQASLDMSNAVPVKSDKMYSRTAPHSPTDVLISSNNSSSTSLASHVMPNKSGISLNGNRPPSVYYSRDFLSTLAPREGGYAIAASMGNGLGAIGTMSVEERRRSSVYDNERPRSTTRAPVSRSAGMGRWSLDGGEHYGKPYVTSSNNTTSTSLSRGPTSADPSPPAEDDKSSLLPEGAASPAIARSSVDQPVPPPVSSVPMNPSPLSRETPADMPSPKLEDVPVPPMAPAAAQALPIATPVATTAAPAPSTQPSPLNAKKSKKDLKLAAKEAKAAEKAAALKVSLQRAEAAKAAAAKKEADKAAAKKQKDDAKRQAKLDKERKKAEKKAGLKAKLKSASNIALPKSSTPSSGTAAPSTSSIPPVPPLPTQTIQTADARSGVPFPRAQSATRVPTVPVEEPRKTAVSMPLGSARTAPPAAEGATVSSRSRLGMLGTIKKRLSVFGDLKGPEPSKPVQIPPTPPKDTTLARTAAAQPSPAPAIPDRVEPRPELSRMVTPPRSVTDASPEPLTQLPPRSSSYSPAPAQPSIQSQFASPLSQHSSQMAASPIPQSPTLKSPQQVQTSPLSKSVSRDEQGFASGSPSSSVRRGTSVRGPRPMPRSAHSPTPEKHADKLVQHDLVASAPEVATPTEFTESVENDSTASMLSQTASKDSQATDLASPYTSEDLGDYEHRGKAVDTPERAGSDETVQPVLGVPAGLTVAAH